MQDWKVFYRDDLDQDRTARSGPSEEAALEQAMQLYLEKWAEIYRIEGPGGLILPKREIMRRIREQWSAENHAGLPFSWIGTDL
jgi:hypothetical protein